jgi:hypothetical protein
VTRGENLYLKIIKKIEVLTKFGDKKLYEEM